MTSEEKKSTRSSKEGEVSIDSPSKVVNQNEKVPETYLIIDFLFFKFYIYYYRSPWHLVWSDRAMTGYSATNFATKSNSQMQHENDDEDITSEAYAIKRMLAGDY
jgi:hypothetical protein